MQNLLHGAEPLYGFRAFLVALPCVVTAVSVLNSVPHLRAYACPVCQLAELRKQKQREMEHRPDAMDEIDELDSQMASVNCTLRRVGYAGFQKLPQAPPTALYHLIGWGRGFSGQEL